jgi:SAM-dependent methyltransferase
LYPEEIRVHARRHWTPLHIARQASHFLGTHAGARVLDIGSGVGKFCLAAAYYKPFAFFTGVEQRANLVEYANKAGTVLDLRNCEFIHSNFTQLDFHEFDHFYFYNSFYENLADTDKIDESIAYSDALYYYYSRQLYSKLDEMPPGTRLVTYYSLGEEVPKCFSLVGTGYVEFLKYWIKI